MFQKSQFSLKTDIRSKPTDDPCVRRLCSKGNSSSSEPPAVIFPSPALSPRSEEVINIAKLAVILILFSEQALRCSFLPQSCHSGSSLPVWYSHYLSVFLTPRVAMTASRRSQEEAMKPHEKTPDRGLLLARKGLSCCRPVPLHPAKRL